MLGKYEVKWEKRKTSQKKTTQMKGTKLLNHIKAKT